MSSWATITMKMNCRPDDTQSPTGLLIDSGIDEQGWINVDQYYALSHGRYQSRRFDAHLENMHAPQYSGVELALVADIEDTGDTVTIDVYTPKQETHSERKDGYQKVNTYEGRRFPAEEREEFSDYIGEEYGINPVIEPIETVVGPDMVLTKEGDNE